MTEIEAGRIINLITKTETEDKSDKLKIKKSLVKIIFYLFVVFGFASGFGLISCAISRWLWPFWLIWLVDGIIGLGLMNLSQSLWAVDILNFSPTIPWEKIKYPKEYLDIKDQWSGWGKIILLILGFLGYSLGISLLSEYMTAKKLLK